MDQLACAYVAPLLQPGEGIRWVGCVLQPTAFNALGVPKHYAHHVAVGTDRRLMLTQADATFALVATNAALKPALAHPVISWWYDELGEVEAGGVEGLTSGRAFQLHPFESCGPFRGESRRYDVFGTTPGFSATAMEGERYFQWVGEGVGQRAFPVDPAKQPHAAAWYRAWPLQRERRLKRRASGRRLKSILLALVAALGVGFFAFYEWETGQACLSSGASSGRNNQRIVAQWEQMLTDVKAGKSQPACRESGDRCICVERALVEKEPWQKNGRTKAGADGALCYDAAGVEARLQESQRDAARIRELVTTGERHRFAAVGLGAVAVLGLVLTIWKTRPEAP